jgi:hypothetical protein
VVDWFAYQLLLGGVFGRPKNMCPAPLEIVTEGGIGCPSIANDCSREVLAEDFCKNITTTTFPEGVERVAFCPERPNPRLFTISFDTGFINVDDFSITNLLSDSFVFTATGACNAINRVPRGRIHEIQSVELFQSDQRSSGKAVGDRIWTELPAQ